MKKTGCNPSSPPRLSPHRFIAARAKPTAPRASTRTTTPIGVFIVAGEPPADAHANAQDQRKEVVIVSPRCSQPLPHGKQNRFPMSLQFCRRRRRPKWTIAAQENKPSGEPSRSAMERHRAPLTAPPSHTQSNPHRSF
jgi:hypothetical protein